MLALQALVSVRLAAWVLCADQTQLWVAWQVLSHLSQSSLPVLGCSVDFLQYLDATSQYVAEAWILFLYKPSHSCVAFASQAW